MALDTTKYERVTPTQGEINTFVRKAKHQPNVDRLRCKRCGLRFWGSGLAIGSHERSGKCAEKETKTCDAIAAGAQMTAARDGVVFAKVFYDPMYQSFVFVERIDDVDRGRHTLARAFTDDARLFAHWRGFIGEGECEIGWIV